MNTPLAKIQNAIKKFLGLGKPALTSPIGGGKTTGGFFTTPGGLTPEQERQIVERIRADFEKQFGKKMLVVNLGRIPCPCDQCQRARKAQWN